ncbi:P-loop containing nucleoside triphosphate hydrolase protein [Infundibulicybe gibba]|nr:P-loop containing nucleoside triphosphate hydrolase protein [Infundibulicybe gibba]
MDDQRLVNLPALSEGQRHALRKGNFHTVTDILLGGSPQDIARKCRISPIDAKKIVFTTGDPHLDASIGGGIKTGMLWEIVGESAAGKTQFALQLSLFVQTPYEIGGLCGSTCYLTTSSTLPTSRLVQILGAHPALSPSLCGLQDIHTMSTPTIPALIQVLSQTLPPFIEQKTRDAQSKPVKLLVIDAIAELFHTSDKTSTNTLVERAQNIAEISVLLHSLASTHRIAVLVLNEVIDVFNQDMPDNDGANMAYSIQSRWFGRADSIPGEDRKEASLGLVWANQVNARILLSRTGRRRYLDTVEICNAKRRRNQEGSPSTPERALPTDEPVLVRRLSVIFSSVSGPVSLDYVVTAQGITVLPDENIQSPTKLHRMAAPPTPCEPPPSDISFVPTSNPNEIEFGTLPPLDIGSAGDIVGGGNQASVDPEGDDWEKYWGCDDIPADAYYGIDGLQDPPATS